MIAHEIQLRYVIRDKIQSETKFSRKKNFYQKKNFARKRNSQIFSQTEFHLGLNLSQISSALF